MRHGVQKSGTGDADTSETSVLCSNSSLDRIKKKNLANAPELITLFVNVVTSEIFGSHGG